MIKSYPPPFKQGLGNITRLNIACSPMLPVLVLRVIFESYEIVKKLMAKAKTCSGLKVFSSIIDKVYETGKKVAITKWQATRARL